MRECLPYTDSRKLDTPKIQFAKSRQLVFQVCGEGILNTNQFQIKYANQLYDLAEDDSGKEDDCAVHVPERNPS